MKVQDIDRASNGNRPLTNALRWLRTTLSPTGAFWDIWNSDQRVAASQALAEAEELMAAPLTPQLFSVTVEPLTASNGTTYVVYIDRANRAPGAKPWEGMRMPVINRNDVNEANFEGHEWAAFLGVDFTECKAVDSREPNTVPEYGASVKGTVQVDGKLMAAEIILPPGMGKTQTSAPHHPV